ncbi:hypothetical protein LBMAG25_07870 [Bacteroidota bacterium]|nr:hypothetical protein LBMAG25_07870 [Bacteroidota bacterium]
MKLRLIIVIIPVFMTLQSYNTHGQESITEPSKYSFTFHSGIPFYYANDRAGSERGRSIYLLLDKQLKPTLSIGIKPQFIQYYTADIINKYSYLNKHLDLTIQLKKQIINHRLFKLQLGGGIGISYSDYIPYARYYWGVFPGSLPGMISQYIFEIQPIIDPMADLQIPITSSITFQMSGGIKTYFLNYAMNNTGLNYSNNDLFGLIYWGGGLRFKL